MNVRVWFLQLLVLATLAIQFAPTHNSNTSATILSFRDGNGPVPPWRDGNGPVPPWQARG
jgi:hypothetical protein